MITPSRFTGVRAAFGLLLLVVVVGCAGTGGGRELRSSRNVLTRAQMLAGNYTNAYTAVEALRSNWLRPRGPDSFNTPSQVWVYLDGARYGDVESLKQIQTSQINAIRWIDGPTATGQWGVGHGAGVILVVTWSPPPGLAVPEGRTTTGSSTPPMERTTR